MQRLAARVWRWLMSEQAEAVAFWLTIAVLAAVAVRVALMESP